MFALSFRIVRLLCIFLLSSIKSSSLFPIENKEAEIEEKLAIRNFVEYLREEKNTKKSLNLKYLQEYPNNTHGSQLELLRFKPIAQTNNERLNFEHHALMNTFSSFSKTKTKARKSIELQ